MDEFLRRRPLAQLTARKCARVPPTLPRGNRIAGYLMLRGASVPLAPHREVVALALVGAPFMCLRLEVHSPTQRRKPTSRRSCNTSSSLRTRVPWYGCWSLALHRRGGRASPVRRKFRRQYVVNSVKVKMSFHRGPAVGDSL